LFAVLAVMSIFLMSIAPAAGESEPAPDREPSAILANEGSQPQVTPYFVRTTSGAAVNRGTLSPAGLEVNDTLAEITTSGPMLPRFLINNVGTYTMAVQGVNPLRVYGVSSASVWAKSNEDVQNARFNVIFQKNGGTQHTMRTNTANMGSTPMEFTIGDPPSMTEPLDFRPGDTLGIQIQYTAKSRYPFGPAPGCVVLANSIVHATRIELLCIPLEMNISQPTFSEGKLHIPGRVVDTSDVDKKEELKVNLEIIPSTGSTTIHPSDIQRMNFNIREPPNSDILVNWTWEYAHSDPVDGLYEFKIDVSYGVLNHNYTNSTFVELQFPKAGRSSSGILGSTWFIGLLVVLVLAVIGVAMYWKKRTGTGGGYPPPPYGYPAGARMPRKPPKAKKHKPSKAEKMAIKAAKARGAPPPPARAPPPPPRGPLPQDRTPMPGRAPPGVRGPPHGAPPQGRPPQGRPPQGRPPQGRPPPGMAPPRAPLAPPKPDR
jgi:hypothetical protein